MSTYTVSEIASLHQVLLLTSHLQSAHFLIFVVRFPRDPNLNHQALGMETVFANALTGCNLGAAAGGADFNPHNKSEAEIQRYVVPVPDIRDLEF